MGILGDFLKGLMGIPDPKPEHSAPGRDGLEYNEVIRNHENTARQLNEYLRSLGFSYVTADLGGYRTGSMNAFLKKE